MSYETIAKGTVVTYRDDDQVEQPATIAKVMARPTEKNNGGRYRVTNQDGTVVTVSGIDLVSIDGTPVDADPTPTVDTPTDADAILPDTGAAALASPSTYAKQADGSTIVTTASGRTFTLPAPDSDRVPGIAVGKSYGQKGVQSVGRFLRKGYDGTPGSEDMDATYRCDYCGETTGVNKFPTISATAYRLTRHRACNSDALAATGKSTRDRASMAN